MFAPAAVACIIGAGMAAYADHNKAEGVHLVVAGLFSNPDCAGQPTRYRRWPLGQCIPVPECLPREYRSYTWEEENKTVITTYYSDRDCTVGAALSSRRDDYDCQWIEWTGAYFRADRADTVGVSTVYGAHWCNRTQPDDCSGAPDEEYYEPGDLCVPYTDGSRSLQYVTAGRGGGVSVSVYNGTRCEGEPLPPWGDIHAGPGACMAVPEGSSWCSGGYYVNWAWDPAGHHNATTTAMASAGTAVSPGPRLLIGAGCVTALLVWG